MVIAPVALYYRAQPDGRVRVWTEEDAAYGCFDVLSPAAFAAVKGSGQYKGFSIKLEWPVEE